MERGHLPFIELVEHLPTNLEFARLGSGLHSAALSRKTNQALRDFFITGDAPVVSLQDPEKHTASAWDMGQLLQATIAATRPEDLGSGASKRALNRDVAALNQYWDERSTPPGFDSHFGAEGIKYYDDNIWIGISLLDAYRKFSNSADLARAKDVFAFLEFGTNGTETLDKPGGVFWSQEPNNLYRATVSTAGGAQLALKLYQETKDPRYLEFAKEQFDWVNKNLLGPDGTYYDGMDPDGTIHPQEYTYNQGLMLGDATLLYLATGNREYLEQAREIAGSSLKRFDEHNEKARSEGVESFPSHHTFFNAVFFKNLMLLDSVAPNPKYGQALSNYSKHLSRAVDPETGVVTIDGAQTLLKQASAVQIFALAEQIPNLKLASYTSS